MDTDQLLAGYLVAARGVRTDWQDTGLLSADLISMSDCVVDLVSANRDGWDDWFDDPVSAEQSRTGAGRSGLHVLAVGIAVTDAPALLQEMADAGHRPDMGGLVEDVRQATGVRPGRWGLIQDEPEARRAAAWLTASRLGDPKVFLWVPALLVDVSG